MKPLQQGFPWALFSLLLLLQFDFGRSWNETARQPEHNTRLRKRVSKIVKPLNLISIKIEIFYSLPTCQLNNFLLSLREIKR